MHPFGPNWGSPRYKVWTTGKQQSGSTAVAIKQKWCGRFYFFSLYFLTKKKNEHTCGADTYMHTHSQPHAHIISVHVKTWRWPKVNCWGSTIKTFVTTNITRHLSNLHPDKHVANEGKVVKSTAICSSEAAVHQQPLYEPWFEQSIKAVKRIILEISEKWEENRVDVLIPGAVLYVLENDRNVVVIASRELRRIISIAFQQESTYFQLLLL